MLGDRKRDRVRMISNIAEWNSGRMRIISDERSSCTTRMRTWVGGAG